MVVERNGEFVARVEELGLEGVVVGVDEARDDQAATGIDHLGVGCAHCKRRSDGDDNVVADEHVAVR